MSSTNKTARMPSGARRRGAALAAGIGTLGFTGAILAAGFTGGAGDAGADALCDQMRAQYGPSWPCISVPTYTPPPTMPTQPSTPNAPGSPSGNGPVIGGDAGPGPGQGNGTPIIGGTTPAPRPPGNTQAPASRQPPGVPTRQAPGATTTVTPAPGQREEPGQSGQRDAGSPGHTTAPADMPVGEPHSGSSDEALLSPSTDDEPTIPLPIWVIAGAAAVAAASPRGRSLLKRGGSTRATVGPSRMVLMHDESSPTTYRFAMNVPDGGYTKVNPDGSAIIYDKDGNTIRQVARPWAFDAAGRPQKTWYTVDENGDLVQHIEPADNALFPILADPMDTGAAAGANVGASLGAQADAPAPAPQPAQPQPDQPQSNSDAMGDLLMPSFDESAPTESSEPEFNQYNPLTYPDTTGGGDGQAQPDQAQSDALGELMDPSFDESATPESSEPEFNQYNPLTYPDTSQSGDGQSQPDQSQPDQAQSDALGELLDALVHQGASARRARRCPRRRAIDDLRRVAAVHQQSTVRRQSPRTDRRGRHRVLLRPIPGPQRRTDRTPRHRLRHRPGKRNRLQLRRPNRQNRDRPTNSTRHQRQLVDHQQARSSWRNQPDRDGRRQKDHDHHPSTPRRHVHRNNKRWPNPAFRPTRKPPRRAHTRPRNGRRRQFPL